MAYIQLFENNLKSKDPYNFHGMKPAVMAVLLFENEQLSIRDTQSLEILHAVNLMCSLAGRNYVNTVI